MLVDKQPYFENYHSQKHSYEENSTNQTLVIVLFFLVFYYKTVSKSDLAAKVDGFNLSSKLFLLVY